MLIGSDVIVVKEQVEDTEPQDKRLSGSDYSKFSFYLFRCFWTITQLGVFLGVFLCPQ